MSSIKEPEPTANEDFMREHGLLNRLLLIYERLIYLIEADVNCTDIVLISAYIIRIFVEDYHEKMEETYVFPVLLAANQQVELVNELIKQHQLGRELTDEIMILSQNLKTNDNINKIIQSMRLFITMYRYHESREDTEIFFEFKKLLSDEKYEEMGEIMEESEQQIFGEDGYNKLLNIVKYLEKKLDIFDISKESQKTEHFLKTVFG